MKMLIKLLSVLALALIVQNPARAEWIKQNAGTFSWLHSVYFVNQTRGWIVGSKGTYLETTDGGKTWKTAAKFTDDNIKDVYFADEDTGWVLCERDIFSSGSLSPSYIMKTENGGQTWANQNLEGEGSERLARMFFPKNAGGWAVGEAGTLYAMQTDLKTWKKVPIPVRYLMLDGNFSSGRSGILVGGRGASIFTEDGGLTWNPSNFTAKPQTKLSAVFFINDRQAWAVGAEGRIFTTSNGGKFWREQLSNVKQDLFSVWFLNSAEGWAVGDKGTILRTQSGGNVWIEVEAPAIHKLERVVFVGNRGWAVGFGGTILSYDPSKPAKPKQSPAKPSMQRKNS